MRTYTTPSSNSSSIISGIPASVAKFANYQDTLRSALEAAVTKAAQDFERQIQSKARSSWGELAGAIKVTVAPDLTLHIGVDESVADEVHELEYGGPGSTPTGVLRMAAVDAPNSLKQRLQHLLDEELK